MKNPEIRFKKDKKDWKKHSMKDSITYHKKSQFPASFAKQEGKYRFFRSDSSDKPVYSDLKLIDCAAIIMNDGGQCDFKYFNGPFAYSDHCICFSFKENNEYLYQFLLLNKDMINRDGFIGCALKNIDRNYFNNLLISIPSLEIQNKVASLFSDIDIKIENEVRLIEKLNIAKKSMLEKLFPQEDNDVPDIRFCGFTDTWEQRKLSEIILDIADGPFGSNLKTEHYTDEKEARVIQLSNLSDYGWQDENTRYTTFNHANTIKRCVVNKDELIMGKMMPAGMTIMCPNNEKMYVLSSDCVRIKLNNKALTNKFFLYTTKCDVFLNQVNNDSQGSTRIRTSISKIREMNFAIPEMAEQMKIGTYFQKFDNLITLHQRKLKKYKEIKLALLEKLLAQ